MEPPTAPMRYARKCAKQDVWQAVGLGTVMVRRKRWLGSLVARYLRTSTTSWFKAHQTIQSLLAGPVIITGWSLGVAVVANSGAPHFESTHTVRPQTE